MKRHGWERFGENNSDTIPGYIEGPWLTKHNGKYYMQYAAPGQNSMSMPTVYTWPITQWGLMCMHLIILSVLNREDL